jgi:hypothetical protein
MLQTRTIESLSAENMRELQKLRSQWRDVGLCVAPTDRRRAEAGMRAAYKAAGLAPPKLVIWLKSPRAGQTAINLLKSDVEWPERLLPVQRAVWNHVWQELVPQIKPLFGEERWSQVRREIKKEATDKIIGLYGQYFETQAKALFAERMGIWVWKYLRQVAGNPRSQEIHSHVEDRVKARLEAVVSHAVGQRIYDELVTPLRQQVWVPITERLRRMMTVDNAPLAVRQTWELCYGQHDCAWLAYYEFLRKLGVKGTEDLGGMQEVARSSGWWWPLENLCIMTERPTEMHRDNRGRLDNAHGMAIRYPDGWGFYCARGTLIPAEVITEPITMESIDKEPNVEVRRVMIERLGLANYLKFGKAVRLHQDKCGTLYRLDMRNDEPIVVVQVINSTPEPDGTYNEYFLRVPPTMTRARQAVAWTFAISEEQYYPVAET